MGCARSSHGVDTPVGKSARERLAAQQESTRPPATATGQEVGVANPILLNSINTKPAENSLRAEKAASDTPLDSICVPRKPFMQSKDALRDMLEASGVSTKGFGIGTSKSLGDLLNELETSSCYFEHLGTAGSADRPRVLRVVEPVYIRLCWRGLFLVQESQEFTDGRTQNRRIYLSDKKRIQDAGGLFCTIARILHEELGISKRELLLSGVLLYREDTYQFEIERLNSSSYPGLPSEYRTHHVQVDILESGLDLFAHCGLPDCRDFSTKKAGKAGITSCHWRWYTMDNAMRSDIVKLAPEAMVAKIDRDRSRIREIRVVPLNDILDAQDLSKILETNGVDVERFGSGNAKQLVTLHKELRSGESALEICHKKQEVRLVSELIFMQVRWHEKVCVEVGHITGNGRLAGQTTLVVTSKVPSDRDMFSAAVRGLAERFDLKQDKIVLNETVKFRADLYCNIAENMESDEYPGLTYVKVSHYCRIDILEAGLRHFRDRGLPEGAPFSSAAPFCGAPVTRWQWWDVEEARKQDVTGFPDVPQSCHLPDDVNGNLHELVDTADFDAPTLRAALEKGGVAASAWGERALASLLWELKSGFSTFEAHKGTGKVRRVLEPTLVHAMVHTDDSEDGGFHVKDVKDHTIYRSDIAKFELVHVDALSYPGLPCVHQTHALQFEQVPNSQVSL